MKRNPTAKGTQQAGTMFPKSLKRFGAQQGRVPGRIPGARDISQNPKTFAMGAGGDAMEVTKTYGQNLIGKKLSFKLTTDGTYANGVIPIIPQFPDDALPTGVAFSGSNFASYAEFAKFACRAKLVLGRLQVTTDNTNNFTEAIKVTITDANGARKSVTETWDSIALDLNAQVQGTKIIEYTGWIIGDIFNRYEINTMTDSTYFQFTFTIVGVGGKVYDIAPAE